MSTEEKLQTAIKTLELCLTRGFLLGDGLTSLIEVTLLRIKENRT